LGRGLAEVLDRLTPVTDELEPVAPIASGSRAERAREGRAEGAGPRAEGRPEAAFSAPSSEAAERPTLDGSRLWRPPQALITPHPEAPIFSRPDAALTFNQILAEVEAGNYPATEAFLKIFRQAGLVSLWFYLRCILSFNGPYAEIDANIHLEMCNFRQEALKPSSRAACIMPRSGLKSTINTHGAGTWELTRNPELAVGIVSFPADRAIEFYKQVKSNFENNALLAELYPETVPEGLNGTRWTDKELVMPARRMPRQDPSLKPITAGGATQGIHLDVALFDDLVGDSMLDADRHATADMVKQTNWFKDNQSTILKHPEKSRVFFSFTRYGLVDPGEDVMLGSCEHAGDWFNVESWYPLRSEGKWRTYYRSGRGRDGQSILPDRFSTAFLDEIQKTNPVGYQLYYANDPHIPEAADLSMYDVKECRLDFNPDIGYTIVFPHEGTAVTLRSTDVVQILDPAGGTPSAKTRRSQLSQTAHTIQATLKDGRTCILFARAEFVKTSTWWDWLFKSMQMDLGIRRTAVELQAGFKSLQSLIEEEVVRRSIPLRFEPINALGDKDTTIRAYVQPKLEKGLLYATPQARPLVQSAVKTFPGGRKDVLDAIKIGIYIARTPLTQDEREAYEEKQALALVALGRNPTTGY
jgi:hypothetical protein